jgi:hypothetical protein
MHTQNTGSGSAGQAEKKPRYQPLTRAQYDAVAEFAESLAKDSGLPFDEVLQDAIELREGGHLTMVLRDGRLSLVGGRP